LAIRINCQQLPVNDPTLNKLQPKIMFTGLIQALGTVRSLGGNRLQISPQSTSAPALWQDLAEGDSVAVDGVCLTVEEVLSPGFIAYASGETLYRTTLNQRLNGDAGAVAPWVNLETSLRVGSKLGGHFVTGHVDGIGQLQKSVKIGDAWEISFTAVPEFAELWQQQIAPYILSKGSIAINGISLTVADCDRDGTWFMAAVIPHTFNQTNLCDLQPGSWVNLESDILGKYTEKLLRHRLRAKENSFASTLDEITPAFLAEHGYF
jgi:riboflavin synthase